MTFKKYIHRPTVVKAKRMKIPQSVKTLEGIMQGKAGDFLVKGIYDELYIVDEFVFKASYDPMPKK